MRSRVQTGGRRTLRHWTACRNSECGILARRGTRMASDDSADVVVVGTGVVGCLIAEQALDAGLSVLMLEAGPRVDRGRIGENYRNLPPSLRLFHWDAPYPPKPWAR